MKNNILLLIPIYCISVVDFGLGHFFKFLTVFVPILGLFIGGIDYGKSSWLLFAPIIYLFVSLFGVAPSLINHANLGYMLTDALFPLLFISTFFQSWKNVNLNRYYEGLLKACVISFLVFCCSTLVSLLFGDKSLFLEEQGVSRFAGTLGPPATSIFLVAISIPILSYAFKSRSYYYFAVYICIQSLVILTNTRMVMLGSFLVFLYFFWTSDVNIRLKIISSILFGGPVAIFIFLSIASRLFFEGEHSGIDAINLNGRDILWENAFLYIFDDWLFGQGLGAATDFLMDIDLGDGLNRQFHNDYIKIVFISGVTGLLLFFLIVFNIFRLAKYIPLEAKFPIDRRAVYSYLLFFLIVMLTDNIYVYYFYIYPMFLYLGPIALLVQKR